MSRLVVGGLVDLLRVDNAAQIDVIARDARFDRDYTSRGPILNRYLVRRLRQILVLDGRPLPPVAPRGDERPVAAQASVAARLDALVDAGIDGPEVDALAAYVRGEGKTSEAGRLAQQAVGRLFDSAYLSDADSWSDAEVMSAAPSTFNPLKMLLWALTGRVNKARAALAAKVGNDPTGLHATGVAIKNLETSFVKMRELYANPAKRRRLSGEAAAGMTLTAPRQVLRQPVKAGQTDAGQFSENTLVLLRLEKAHARDPGDSTAFMAESWAECPARRWVPALLRTVWNKALGAGL